MRTWSVEQSNIFDFVVNGHGNGIVQASAGSGKTTTLIEANKRALQKNPSLRTTFVCFGKAIAAELCRRGVNGKTFHSLCMGSVLRHFSAINGHCELDINKLFTTMKTNMNPFHFSVYGKACRKLVGLAKNTGIGIPEVGDVEDVSLWQDICDMHNLENMLFKRGTFTPSVDDLIQHAQTIFSFSLGDTSTLDFDDIIYHAAENYEISLPFNHITFVDECQDVNVLQRIIIEKMAYPDGRVICIGDEHQAIYGFRGAGCDSMEMLRKRFDCVELPLSVSYRCASSIVEYAQQWSNHIDARPNAPMGQVKELRNAWDVDDIKDGDMVVCRLNAPLVGVAVGMLIDNRKFKFDGSMIGIGMKTIINKLKAKSISDLVDKVHNYYEYEYKKAKDELDDAKAEQIKDMCNCILVVTDKLGDGRVDDVSNYIDRLFSDVQGGVILSTIHKAKGLEADTVWWLDYDNCPGDWAQLDWEIKQENNMCYVATTRAINTLLLISQ